MMTLLSHTGYAFLLSPPTCGVLYMENVEPLPLYTSFIVGSLFLQFLGCHLSMLPSISFIAHVQQANVAYSQLMYLP